MRGSATSLPSPFLPGAQQKGSGHEAQNTDDRHGRLPDRNRPARVAVVKPIGSIAQGRAAAPLLAIGRSPHAAAGGVSSPAEHTGDANPFCPGETGQPLPVRPPRKSTSASREMSSPVSCSCSGNGSRPRRKRPMANDAGHGHLPGLEEPNRKRQGLASAL